MALSSCVLDFGSVSEVVGGNGNKLHIIVDCVA